MSLVGNLVGFGLRQVIGVVTGDQAGELAGNAAGLVVKLVEKHFTDHSQKLPKALAKANDRAWQGLSIALAGDGFLDKIKVFFASADDKGIREQVRLFLQDKTISFEGTSTDFRKKCLTELSQAKKAGLLTAQKLSPNDVARQTVRFKLYADQKGLIDGAEQVVGQIADELAAEYRNLAKLLRQRRAGGPPLLVSAFAYFFRREVETDDELAHGLLFDGLRQLSASQAKAFGEVNKALTSLGDQFEQVFEQLARIETVVVETQTVTAATHGAVLDLQGQLKSHSEQIQQIGNAVMNMLAQHQLHHRELRPGDSLSIRNDKERQLVKQVVARYRGLSEGERQQVPALLNAIGKLEVVAGDFDAAQKDFQAVSLMATDNTAKAEAHFNAYRTALERRDFDTAKKEFIEAVKLDAKRFAPFPVGKYQPKRILGAGGFGVAFLCRHKDLKADVAIKTLTGDDLGRNVDEVLTEARVLYQMDHPAIIRLLDCGYTIPAEKARPYFVMNFFESETLEEYVQKHGPLSPQDLMTVARQMAEGLQAAHAKGILHRDVKPANMLVRRDESGWQVKLIDFGLALKQSVIEAGASTAKRSKTVSGSSIAGTLDYAAPEQMGKSPGVSVGAYSDIYGFGKTCCYALFKTTHPLPKHWKSLPNHLAELLENCLEEEPKKRPQAFSQVISQLTSHEAALEKGEETKAASEAKGLADAKRLVKNPAITLVAAGILGLAVSLIGTALFALAFLNILRFDMFYFWHAAPAAATAILYLILSAASGVAILAGLNMLKFRRYRLCMVGSVAVMPAALICLPLGLTIGIWSLMTLRKPEVRSAFS